MGNRYIGTVDFELGGDKLTLRPTFAAVIAFEEITGLSIREALALLAVEKVSAKVIVSALWAGIKGEAIAINKPELEKDWEVLGERVAHEGYAAFVGPATDFLSNAWMSDEKIQLLDDAAKKKLPQTES